LFESPFMIKRGMNRHLCHRLGIHLGRMVGMWRQWGISLLMKDHHCCCWFGRLWSFVIFPSCFLWLDQLQPFSRSRALRWILEWRRFCSLPHCCMRRVLLLRMSSTLIGRFDCIRCLGLKSKGFVRGQVLLESIRCWHLRRGLGVHRRRMGTLGVQFRGGLLIRDRNHRNRLRHYHHRHFEQGSLLRFDRVVI